MEVAPLVTQCREEFALAVVGQLPLFDALMTSLMTGGHILLEGLPGLAKTTAAKTFAAITGLTFRRVQFTPDLLPQDITGTLVYEQSTGKFIARKGPIFANVVLADEINRAGAKVQSALLEAMQERQVTLGTATLMLPQPFIVVATENPIDEDGTYALPAAERDRFLMKEVVPYPTGEEECAIAAMSASPSMVKDFPPARTSRVLVADSTEPQHAVLDADKVSQLQKECASVTCSDELVRYIVEIVRATRPEPVTSEIAGASGTPEGRVSRRQLSDDVEHYVSVGASPRGSIALVLCAKARALIAGRDFVLPEDVKAAAPAALRHRLSFTFQASSDEVTADDIIERVLATIPVP